jgi:hypothetical protein
VTGRRAGICCHNEVRAVEAGFGRVDEITVEIRRGMQAVGLVDARAAEEGLPGLFAVGVEVENGDGSTVRWCIGGSGWEGFVGEQGEAVVVGDKTAGYLISLVCRRVRAVYTFFAACDGDSISYSLKSIRVHLLNVHIGSARVEVSEIGRLEIRRNRKWGTSMVRIPSPVGLLDRIERASKLKSIDVFLNE